MRAPSSRESAATSDYSRSRAASQVQLAPAPLPSVIGQAPGRTAKVLPPGMVLTKIPPPPLFRRNDFFWDLRHKCVLRIVGVKVMRLESFNSSFWRNLFQVFCEFSRNFVNNFRVKLKLSIAKNCINVSTITFTLTHCPALPKLALHVVLSYSMSSKILDFLADIQCQSNKCTAVVGSWSIPELFETPSCQIQQLSKILSTCTTVCCCHPPYL